MFVEVCGLLPFIFSIQKVGRRENQALMEAVVKQASSDANMNPKNVKKSLWYRSMHTFLKGARRR